MHELDLVERLRRQVVRRYAVRPRDVRVVRAPYRICPLGAHVDHQLGLVTAMAIDQGVYVAYAPTSGPLRLSSLDFPGEVTCPLSQIVEPRKGDWGDFVRGAVYALSQHSTLRHAICGVTAGRLDGGGLSSSAAIGVALLLALQDANSLSLTPHENIRLDAVIENEYLGLHIGILDQAAILLSRHDHLTYLDCRTQDFALIPNAVPSESWRALIVFSGLKQALGTTDYNRRVSECREAAARLLAAVGRVRQTPALRDLEPDEYARHADILTGPPARRARHFFSEMQRVREGVERWRCGDLIGFGRLMSASGESSIRNYECGSPPLIDLYEILTDTAGVYGARFSGAGFRGCCVALVSAAAADQAAASALSRYRRRQPTLADRATAFVCGVADGAGVLPTSADPRDVETPP